MARTIPVRVDYCDTNTHLINFSVLNASGCERPHQQSTVGVKCKWVCRRELSHCLYVLKREIVYVGTSEVTVMKECDDSDRVTRRQAGCCCCCCRGEYIRITYTLWPLFRAAFCIQNNIKGLFILHCLSFVLSEAVEAVRACTREYALVHEFQCWKKEGNLLPFVEAVEQFCFCSFLSVEEHKCLTVSDDGQNGQIHLSFPEGALLQGDAIACGSKDVPERNTQKHAFVPPPVSLVSMCDKEHPLMSLC